MSDLSKQDNNLPAKQNHLLAIILGVAGNLATKIVEAAPGIITGLAGYSAYLSGLGWHWIILIVVIVFCAAVWLLNGILFLKDKRKLSQVNTIENKGVDERTILSILPKESEKENLIKNRTEIILKAEHQIALEDLTSEHRKEIESLKEKYQKTLVLMQANFETELLQRDTLLDKIDFLLESVKQQSENITAYVAAENVKYSDHNFHEYNHLKIVFVLRVFNKSVFDITFEETVNGRLNFNREPFLEQKRFFETPPVIKSLEVGFIRIEQRLSKPEMETLKNVMQKVEEERKKLVESGYASIPIIPQIDFSELILTVEGSKKFPQVLPKRLNTFNLKFDVTKREFNL